MEKAKLTGVLLVMAKLDVQKAFDSVKHVKVSEALIAI